MIAFGIFLRSVRRVRYLSQTEELQVRRLLLQYGERDSLGYFATRRDKAVVFSPDNDAAIAYRVVNGVSLASGDPLGDPAAWPAAIQRWLAEARVYGWSPAVLSASEEAAHAYVDAGLRALAMGDEAIIDVADFSLEGRTMRPVRQAVTRAQRAGYHAEVRQARRPVPCRPAGLREAGREVARRADRARLLDGARTARRSGRCALRDGDRARRGGRSPRAAVLRPVGCPRGFARPDAARPRVGERPDGVHGRLARRCLQRSRRPPHLAELRDVPGDLQRRRAGRRRSRTTAHQRAADRGFEVLAAGESLPVEREVPAPLVTPADLLLPRCLARAGAARRRDRRGLPARAAPVDPRRHGRDGRAARDHGGRRRPVHDSRPGAGGRTAPARRCRTATHRAGADPPQQARRTRCCRHRPVSGLGPPDRNPGTDPRDAPEPARPITTPATRPRSPAG